MAQRRRRSPNRTATRSQAPLRLVRDDDVIHEQPVPGPAAPEPVVPVPEGEGEIAVLADLADESLDAIVAGVAEGLLESLSDVRHRYDAEMVIASIFNVVADGLAPEADALERVHAPASLIVQLTAYCQQNPGTLALGLLVLLADQGPAHSRVVAQEAADQMAAQGVVAPRWAAAEVSLKLLRAWRSTDELGEQASLGLLFYYGHREHAVELLIDHALGGGIKDAFFVDGRDARDMHDLVAAGAAQEPLIAFTDISEVEALADLRAALASEPCPEDGEQYEDVDAYLYLVHARVRKLAAALGQPEVELYSDELWRNGGEFGGEPFADDVFRIKVTLADSRPPIWRRLEVPGPVSLETLHVMLQIAFDWTDSHLHAFETGSGADRESLEGEVLRQIPLSSVLTGPKDKLVYVYDFGDDWRHTIVLEDVLAREAGAVYPRCVAGRRAAPPEDCGGIPGYEHLLRVLADPADPEHEQLSAWAGPIDPAALDRTEINQSLKVFEA